MSKGVRVLTVALEGEFKNEALDRMIDTLRMVRGVSEVTAAKIDDMAEWSADDKARREIRQQIVEILYPKDR